MAITVDLESLTGEYSVSRLPVDQPLPDWVNGPGLVNATYAPDEISIVCRADRVPEQTETSSGWSAIKVSTKFGFDEAGVVLSVVHPISTAGLGVFVVSTFYRDYLLVRTNELGKAKQLLLAAGHHFQSLDDFVTIRIATSADTDTITRFHVQVWRKTYDGIAPQSAIDALDENHRRPGWHKTLGTPKPHQRTLIAVQRDRIVGFVSFGPTTSQSGEIKHLYVDPLAKRMGIGADLLSRALISLGDAGFMRATLAVVLENKPAQAFYQAQGGTVTGQSRDAGPLWKSNNLIFEWALSQTCPVDPPLVCP
ncbi:MAG: GNAT family N-acetyltransferase [Rhodobacteraceae bacterium]|nr:GNAT family N-acetyltransferase [Paracoccaceae bacterium]